jgi:hypothetical protein
MLKERFNSFFYCLNTSEYNYFTSHNMAIRIAKDKTFEYETTDMHYGWRVYKYAWYKNGILTINSHNLEYTFECEIVEHSEYVRVCNKLEKTRKENSLAYENTLEAPVIKSTWQIAYEAYATKMVAKHDAKQFLPVTENGVLIYDTDNYQYCVDNGECIYVPKKNAKPLQDVNFKAVLDYVVDIFESRIKDCELTAVILKLIKEH